MHEQVNRIQNREDQIIYLNKKRNPTKRDDSIRGSIFSTPLDIDRLMDYTPPVFEKSEYSVDWIVRQLRRDHFLFIDFSDDEVRMLARAMQREDFRMNDMIIEQGDPHGDFFYLVQSGEVEFRNRGTVVGKCTSGGCFGELALLYVRKIPVKCQAESLIVLSLSSALTFVLDAHN